MSARGFIGTVVLLCVPIACNAANLLSENFDAIPAGLYTAPAAVGTHFNVTSGSIDIIAPGSYVSLSCTFPTSVRCVDMNGETSGTLTTSITFASPGTYWLSFDLIGSQRPAVTANTTVQLGSVFGPQTYTLAWNETPATHVFSFNVPVSQTAMLSFSTTTSGATGLLLDNVVVSNTALVSIPEPNPLFLVFAGMVLLAAGLWKSRHHKPTGQH